MQPEQKIEEFKKINEVELQETGVQEGTDVAGRTISEWIIVQSVEELSVERRLLGYEGNLVNI